MIKRIICKIKEHNTMYWRQDANYCFCTRCGLWWHFNQEEKLWEECTKGTFWPKNNKRSP